MHDVGRTVKRTVARAYLGALGWSQHGDAPDPDQTCIFVGAPHTSGYDTVLMLATAWKNNLRVKFLIKREAIDGPLGPLLTFLGAIPVDRDNPGPLIERLAAAAEQNEGFQLVLTPEGTRKPVKYWKSGFYRFASRADIPIVLVSPDAMNHHITFGPIFKVSNDVHADMDRIRAFFADKNGVNPENRTEPRLRAEDDPESLLGLIGAPDTKAG